MAGALTGQFSFIFRIEQYLVGSTLCVELLLAGRHVRREPIILDVGVVSSENVQVVCEHYFSKLACLDCLGPVVP